VKKPPPRRGVAALLIAAFVVAALACAPALAKRTEDGRIILRLANPERLERASMGRRPGPNIVALFRQRYPEYYIEPASTIQVDKATAGGESGELMAIAGGTAPDVFETQFFGREVQKYAAHGYLSPLGDLLALYEQENGEPYEGAFQPAPIWQTCKYRGQYYAVPWSSYTLQMYWRKDLLRRAGVDPNHAPQNWDELFRTCMACSFPEAEAVRISGKTLGSGRGDAGGRWGMLLYGKAWTYMQFVWAAGGEVVRPYMKCPECGEMVEVPEPRADFRSDHIRIREEEYYYDQGFDQRTVCPKCGEVVVETSVEDALRETGQDLQWRLVINEERALVAYRFYHKLIWQPWTRCENAHDWDEFEITDEMFADGVARCPVCGREYTIEELRERNRLYKGVAAVARDGDPSVLPQFAKGRMAMMICWGGIIPELIRDGLPKESVAMAPVPPSDEEGVAASAIFGGYYAINSQTDAESREAAWRYITFKTSPEVRKLEMRHAIEEGMGVYQSPAMLKRFGFDDILREVPQEWVAIEPLILRTARVEPAFPEAQTLYGEMNVPLDEIESSADADIKAAADRVCSYFNKHVVGELTDRDRAKRRIAAYLLFAALLPLAGLLVFGGRKLVHTAHAAAAAGGPGAVVARGAVRRRAITAGLFLLPAVGSVALWAYVPLLRGATMAFYDYRIVGASEFVGLANFLDVVFAPHFWATIGRTLLYVGMSITMGFGVPIVLAIFLSEVPRFKIFFRLVYYLPALTTAIVTMFLWRRLVFDPTPDGLLNTLVAAVLRPLFDFLNAHFGANLYTVPTFKWLQDYRMAMACVIATGIWAGAGPGSIIYLAAMKGVPDEEYEAAEIDGAGLWHKIRHVTLPNLSALIIITFVGAFIGAFHAMQNVFVLTGGGPQRATHIIGLEIWMSAFMYLKFGYATAMAWILGALLIGFTVQQLRILDKLKFRAGGTGAA